MKKRILKISGLHVWEVSIYYGSFQTIHTSLWITTANRSAETACRKTKRFLNVNRDEYPKARIDTISNRGTLDA